MNQKWRGFLFVLTIVIARQTRYNIDVGWGNSPVD
uniref:Uncharacterized protein n=1 Tax=Siphoviridae sp. ct2hZ16 TaxID=2826276 RepID=A0A8S5QVD6_9CAUD|nr:MAG TPA: hypothetical protein [Siphoviridae sp. ct2hZ16]